MADHTSASADYSGSESTSLSLLERVRLHDPEAWRRFVALYGPVVYGWTLRHGLQPHDAADVAQDVFTAVAQHLDSFRKRSADGGFRGWLWTITRNKVHDHFRRRQEEPIGTGGSTAHRRLERIPELPEHDDEPAETSAAELSHRALALIQNEFETTTWRAFWAIAVDGHAPADVASELGITVAAVYKAKSRVLLRLRHELDGLLE